MELDVAAGFPTAIFGYQVSSEKVWQILSFGHMTSMYFSSTGKGTGPMESTFW
jgi:hypothetical protein